MDQYICKIASREELEKRWNYLIEIHSVNNIWEKFKDNALNNFDNNNTISYVGILDDEIICELTAYIKEEAFIDDIDDYDDLLSDERCYLAAFRTNKEHEGNGYFSLLFDYVVDDLKSRGYSELSLGVEPENVRNMEISFHLGFRDYIKSTMQDDELILFYKKDI
jgi:GNAT superfamily N-acetyltransferase